MTPLITSTQCPNMRGWNTAALETLSGFWGEICRNVSGDAVSPYNAAFQTLLGSGNNCVFYVGSVVADYSFWGMPFNIVPDTTTLRTVSSVGSGNTTPPSLTQGPFAGTQYAENWPTYFLGVSIANTGAGGVAVATGTHFQDAYNGGTVITWPVQVGGTYVVNLALPLLTVASVDSDTQCTFTTPYAGAPVSGASLAGPFNMPYPGVVGGDHHQIVATIGSTTGLPSKLYEGYNIGSTDGGITWGSSSVGEWDLVTGAQNPDTYGASSAAGIPYWPMMPNGDEVFVQHVINHALPVTLGGGGTNGSTPYGLGSGGFVFPASTSNTGVGNPGAWAAGGVPLGGRIRLKSSFSISAFMAANPSATAATQAVLTALQTYGAINIDWSGLASNSLAFVGAADARWIKADVDALQLIPTTSFELVDTVRPRFAITGPASVVYGVQSVWTLTQDPFTIASGAWPGDKDSNYWIGVGVSWSNNAGSTWTAISPSPYGFVATEGQGLGTTPGPFTIDFTPPSAGSYLFQVSYYDSPNFLIPANFAFAANASSGTAYTSNQAGNWATSTIWTPNGVPGAGDTVTINHDVAITANTTIGDGSNSTVLAAGKAATGSLTITGATLTIRGNASIGSGNGYHVRQVLNVNTSSGVAGGIIFDGNVGVAPVMTFADDTQLTVAGTSAAPCFIQTLSTSAGGNGSLNGAGSFNPFYVAISYCAFSRLGSSSVPGLNSPDTDDEFSPTNPPFLMDHCTIDSCGTLPAVNIHGATVNCQFTNCVWTNGLAQQLASIGGLETPLITTGTRLVDHCIFTGVTGFYSPGQLTITNSYLWDIVCSNAWQWAGFDGNFWHRPIGFGSQGGIGVQSCAGDVTNCYFFADASPEYGYFDFLKLGFSNATIHGNIFHYEGSMQMSAVVEGEGSSTTRTCTFTNNICLPNSAGTNGLGLGNLDSNWIQPLVTTVCQHNTICCGSGQAGLLVGAATLLLADAWSSLQSNLFYGLVTPATGQYAMEFAGSYQIVDICPANVINHNGWYRMALTPNNAWGPGSSQPATGDTNVEYNTPYNLPMSGSVVPGYVSGVLTDVQNVNPGFVAPTRNLFTWDASLGGAGTAASAVARIKANLSLTKASLIPYVRAGFLPTASAYLGTGHDDQNIGAV